MATFTQLSEADFQAIAATFALGDVRSFEPIFAGTINSNFALVTERGRFAVRVNEGKSEADVRYEAELLRALHAAGVPAPPPVPTQAGDYLDASSGRLVSVFPWIAGEHVYAPRIRAAHCRAVGAALARLHACGLPLAGRFERAGIYTFERMVERARALAEHPEARPGGALAEALASIGEEIGWLGAHQHTRDAATRGVIHNDLFPGNVFFAPDPGSGPIQVAGLIDFEQASTGSLCFDLAVCINAWCADDLTPAPGQEIVDRARVRAMVDGYQSVRPLEDADRRALRVELRASAMRFTITRITDVYLPGIDKPDKDFRHFLRRLLAWRATDDADLR